MRRGRPGRKGSRLIHIRAPRSVRETTIVANLTEHALTLTEFRFVERISRSIYLKLHKTGLDPEETTITLPGFSLTRFTPEARRDWHRKLAELTKEAELESAQNCANHSRLNTSLSPQPSHHGGVRSIAPELQAPRMRSLSFRGRSRSGSLLRYTLVKPQNQQLR